MARACKTFVIGGVTLESTALPWDKSEDILAEVTLIVTRVINKGKAVFAADAGFQDLVARLGGVAKLMAADVTTVAPVLLPVLLPILETMAEQLVGGTLKRLGPLVLAGTTATWKDDKGEPVRRDLIHAGGRVDLFDDHPGAYFPALFFAGWVTFARFFPVASLVRAA